MAFKGKVQEHCEDVIRRAKAGEVIETWERRQTLEWLENNESLTYRQLAKIFNVSIRTIFQDKKNNKKKRARDLSAMKPLEFIADFLRAQQWVLGNLRRKIESGELSDKEYIIANDKVFNVQLKTLQQLQSLGIMPREISRVAVTHEIWRAEMAEGGMVQMIRQEDEEEQKQLPAGKYVKDLPNIDNLIETIIIKAEEGHEQDLQEKRPVQPEETEQSGTDSIPEETEV